jgi:hypothetical protein
VGTTVEPEEEGRGESFADGLGEGAGPPDTTN